VSSEQRHKGDDGEIICIERLGGLLLFFGSLQ